MGEGEGSHLTLRRAGDFGGVGGSVGLGFPGHKISKQLKSVNMFIFHLARGLDTWVPSSSSSISFSP